MVYNYGYSGIPVVIDAALKGFDNIDLEKVFEAAKVSAKKVH